MSDLNISQLMADTAHDAINFAQHNFQKKLDASPSSLATIDHIIEQIDGDEISDQELFTISYLLGAYIGEIFIKTAGGEWIHHDQTENEPPQTFVKSGDKTIAFPGKVYRALIGEAEQTMSDYYTELLNCND